jgi:hypothetical protein
MSNNHSNGEIDSINEVTSEGSVFDDPLEEEPHRVMSQEREARLSPQNLQFGASDRGSLVRDFKVISKKFQVTTTRSSLPSLRTNILDEDSGAPWRGHDNTLGE